MSREKYEALLIKKQAEKEKLAFKKRNEQLDTLGLYAKVTSDTKSDEFPFAEEFNDKVTYYKKVYEDVTDDELKELMEINQELNGDSFEQSDLTYSKNNIKFSYFLGIMMIIVGFFLFVILLSNDAPIVYALIALFSSLTTASILFSLSQLAAQLNHLIKITIEKDKE